MFVFPVFKVIVRSLDKSPPPLNPVPAVIVLVFGTKALLQPNNPALQVKPLAVLLQVAKLEPNVLVDVAVPA